MNNNIIEELKKCDEEIIKEVSKYCDEYFYNKHRKDQDEKYQDEKYVENQKYVGKCYELKTKNGKRYYKVVSVKGNNQFRVSCLVFDEKPMAKFSPLLQKSIPHHNNEGSIDFNGIYIEDVMINKTFMCVAIEDMTEIREGEWRYALMEYMDQLMKFDWNMV